MATQACLMATRPPGHFIRTLPSIHIRVHLQSSLFVALARSMRSG
jgi:hypothetical protein